MLQTLVAHLRELLLLLNHGLEAGFAGPSNLQGILTSQQIRLHVLYQYLVDVLFEIVQGLVLRLLDLLRDRSEQIIDGTAS